MNDQDYYLIISVVESAGMSACFCEDSLRFVKNVRKKCSKYINVNNSSKLRFFDNSE